MEKTKEQAIGKILIVDDNPKNLQVLGGSLRSKNYIVEFSTTGEEALRWLSDEEFDLILLDIMMPEMDGYETCRKIRNELKNKDVPIIFLTAKTDRESIINGFMAGAQDYITKPFDSAELLARVGTHIELNAARKKLKEFNSLLEKRVEERTKQLNEANKELAALDEVKGEFLNMISHEIRTPLNGIKGSLQLIKIRIENEDLVQLLNILDSSVIRLESFSYSAILITRLKTKKYIILNSSLNLKSELDFCLLPKNDDIQNKGIKINSTECDEQIELETDKELFHELLLRIIDNAVKYSPENGTVNFIANKSNGNINIEISDEGNGFPDKILGKELKLFNPGETHVNKNMGLNLFLSSMISEYLGGSFEINNKESGGALVRLTFPDN